MWLRATRRPARALATLPEALRETLERAKTNVERIPERRAVASAAIAATERLSDFSSDDGVALRMAASRSAALVEASKLDTRGPNTITVESVLSISAAALASAAPGGAEASLREALSAIKLSLLMM